MEQNFALDVEIQKLGKPHGPRPSNVMYSELIMSDNLATGRFTVILIIYPWSTKIGKSTFSLDINPARTKPESRIPPSTWSQTTRA